MADKKDCPSAASHVIHLTKRFPLEFCVADRQNLIHQKNFRLQMRGHRKGETNVHTAGVSFDRRIQKFFDFGKSDDLIKFASDLSMSHAENCAIQIDIL